MKRLWSALAFSVTSCLLSGLFLISNCNRRQGLCIRQLLLLSSVKLSLTLASDSNPGSQNELATGGGQGGHGTGAHFLTDHIMHVARSGDKKNEDRVSSSVYPVDAYGTNFSWTPVSNFSSQSNGTTRRQEGQLWGEEEAVPAKPENVSLLWVTDSMMELAWEEPSKPNGKLEGYRIYYMQNNFTGVVTVKEAVPKMKFALPDLEAWTEYKLWVKAFSWKNEGESSDPILVKTDVRGPGPPRIVNVSCMADDSLYIQWNRPAKFYKSIDFYYVDYRTETWVDFEEIPIPAMSQLLDEQIFLPNLTRNVMYEVRVRGGTRSVIEMDKVYKGDYSDSKKILMEPNCEKARVSVNLPRASNEFTPTMVAISLCASFALFLLLVALVIWRRCFQGQYYYLDDPPRVPGHLNGLGWEGDGGDDLRQSIPAHLFPKHVSELHADSDIGFSKEYEAIQASFVQEEFSAEHSQHPENKQKNRYLNIVAYDHSRVRLQPLPGQKKMVEYVNANYIDGFRKSQAYVGTQGPLPSTFDTFWRMIWEHNVQVIVMITNLVERGRKKCDMYWPSEGTETYGVIQVKFLKESVMATYTVRAFSVRHVKLKKKKKQTSSERTIYHYHYTNWPDHGTPSHPLPVLSYVKKSSAANPVDAGPIIVHCSAGVGRTGTYIVLDAMLRQIRARGDLNVFSFLNHIRAQRNFLVQTEEQYIFIHDSLVEAIECGETNVSKKYFSLYVHNLLSTTYTDDKSQVSSLLERQYKLVTQFKPEEFHLSSAVKPCNLTKNRNLDCVSSDSFRVLLTPKAGVEGSDYINASFLPGFAKLQEWVVTQHPMESTISEFWQMLWDHNIQTVVLLSAVDDQDYPVFWPSNGDDLDLETNCRVKLLQECDRVGCVLRDFSIQSLQDDYELNVKIIQSSHWPHHSTSHPPSSPFDLIHLVQDSLKEAETAAQTGPIAVVDRFGGAEAATFCALTTLYKQTVEEDHADVYMYAKLYHQQRPGVWKTADDYLFLYRSMEAMLGESGSSVSLGGSETPTATVPLPSPLKGEPSPPVDTFLSLQGQGQFQGQLTVTSVDKLSPVSPLSPSSQHTNAIQSNGGSVRILMEANHNPLLSTEQIEILENPIDPV